MFTGKGVLVDQDGLRRSVNYQYVQTGQCGRAGRLFSEQPEVGTSVFQQTFKLECEDGVAMIVIVTQISDCRWVFIGREPAQERSHPL